MLDKVSAWCVHQHFRNTVSLYDNNIHNFNLIITVSVSVLAVILFVIKKNNSFNFDVAFYV